MTESFPRFKKNLTAEQGRTLAGVIRSQKIAPESYLLADCVSVTVNDRKVCLELPLDLGEACVEVPDWVPDGEAARACISIKKKWGIPTGVKLCVYVVEQEVACADFGI
jgi:hypothetical protein